MFDHIILIGVGFTVIAVIIFLLKELVGKGSAQSQLSFAQKSVLTANELRFFKQLRAAYPDHYIFPQVGMSALVQPKYPRDDSRYMSAFGKISQKRIDFVICETTDLSVRWIVELDDRSHNSARDGLRDSITRAAGYKTVRFATARSYEVANIRQKINAVSLLETSTSENRSPIRR